LQKATTWNPDLLAAHAGLEKSYAALGSTDLAIQELVRALPTDQYGDLHYQLAALYRKKGQADLAEKTFQDSEELRKQQLELERQRLDRANRDTNGMKAAP
jgi:tetratricopeptide (TPR) repeat protein